MTNQDSTESLPTQEQAPERGHPLSKPYKDHLYERLQTVDECVGYLEACAAESHETFALGVQDVIAASRRADLATRADTGEGEDMRTRLGYDPVAHESNMQWLKEQEAKRRREPTQAPDESAAIKPTPTPEPVVEGEVESFRIFPSEYVNGYKVSIPCYEGGEVVRKTAYDTLKADQLYARQSLQELRQYRDRCIAILNPSDWKEPLDVSIHTLKAERDRLSVEVGGLREVVGGVAVMLNTALKQYEDEPWALRVRTANHQGGAHE